VRRSFKFRLYPTRAQVAALDAQRDLLRDLWNAAVQQRREAWERQGRTLTLREQNAELKTLREECPQFAAVHFHLLQDVLLRVERGYQQFFERLEVWRVKLAVWRAKGADPKKRPPSPGPPRFKGKWRYRSFTFKDVAHRNGAAMVAGGQRVRVAGVGNVKVKLHRPWEGTIKQITVVATAYEHWYAVLSCDDVPTHPLPKTGEDTGLDVGLTALAATDTESIPNPKFYYKSETKLANAQRRRKRQKKHSKNWRKAGRSIARLHAHVANARRDFQHKLARELVKRYDRIAVEGDLNVAGMARGFLAKSVNDSGMAQFLGILEAKAESAEREFAGPTARRSTQECSGTKPDGSRCTAVVPKTLRDRVHVCPECGLVKDRDQNAAGVLHWRAFGKGPGRGLRGGSGVGPTL
jgi:putative transposase